jgi:hypothetical protein
VRAELQAIVDALLAASTDARVVTLDALGEAIGARAITSEEIDAMLSALEAAGRKVIGPEGGAGEARLKEVVAAARALGPELGRKPTVGEIAARSGLSASEVHHALALLKVMQR